jgi:hypothetical protein
VQNPHRPYRLQPGGLLAALFLLTGCGRGGDWREARADAPKDAPSSGYIRPPQITGAARATDGGTVLSGQSQADVRLRLASPDGGAYGATADDDGRWSISLPGDPAVRLFGLSEEISGRVVQGEGYVAVLPPPGRPAVLLRAGGGAGPLDDNQTLQIAAVDFDAGGSAVVSGAARSGAAVRVALDGVAAGETHASLQGRYTATIPGSIKPGAHQIEVSAGAGAAQASVSIQPPPAQLTGAPYRGQRDGTGWRVDWLTPGGGPQTTLVLDPPEATP